MITTLNHANRLGHLSDAELLQKLVGFRQVKRLYRGTLGPFFCGSPKPGTPEEKCAVARELVKRWLSEELKRAPALSSPAAVRDYLRLKLRDRDHEVFVGIFLDAQNRAICVEELFRGTLTQTSVYPREVVKWALRTNAASIIFAHNHPSGVAEPSRSDEALTQALKQALALVDVKVLDHFIVAGASVMSFTERGLL